MACLFFFGCYISCCNIYKETLNKEKLNKSTNKQFSVVMFPLQFTNSALSYMH